MEIRKLEQWPEWLESERIIGTAFLFGFDEKKTEEKVKKQAAGEEPRDGECWGLFDDDGNMQTSFKTSRENVMFHGNVVSLSEVNMVGSLPESRGSGNVRALMAEVLRTFRARGDLFATLMPFSFAFYRKFGFDLIEKKLTQKIPIEELQPFTSTLTVRQVRSAEDMPALRSMYERSIRDRNLSPLRTEKDWEYHGNGEFGQPDWFTRDKQKYTYIFSDVKGDHAWIQFVFDQKDILTGDMRVTELVYDSPEAFRSVLAFIYGMRAKLVNVVITIPEKLDLSFLIPECSHAEQTLGGHLMGRVLDVEKALQLMYQPEGTGEYHIRVVDEFLSENTGTYLVTYRDGKTEKVERTEQEADLEVGIGTFSQLAVGLYRLQTALYREGTILTANDEILYRVF